MKKLFYKAFLLVILVFSSCENQDWDFPDYQGGTTVYFASQYPVRRIVLGNDVKYDLTIDNMKKCIIMATMGGVYENNVNRIVDITVSDSLLDGFKFENGGDLIPMPSNYYTLSTDKITIPKGKYMGGVEVQLTDAFFADPLALKNNYVIPLIMSNVQNADSILSGSPKLDIVNPHRLVASDWAVLPQDYVLYTVKYSNPWDAVYLRRGVDIITENGVDSTNVRRKQYVEYDEVFNMSTVALNKAGCEVTTTIKVWNASENKYDIQTLNCDLILTFNENNECAITSATEGITASGSGKFVEKGEKNSWNNTDRDVIYLDYQIDFKGLRHYSTKDTLVVRDRKIVSEYFNVVKK